MSDNLTWSVTQEGNIVFPALINKCFLICAKKTSSEAFSCLFNRSAASTFVFFLLHRDSSIPFDILKTISEAVLCAVTFTFLRETWKRFCNQPKYCFVISGDFCDDQSRGKNVAHKTNTVASGKFTSKQYHHQKVVYAGTEVIKAVADFFTYFFHIKNEQNMANDLKPFRFIYISVVSMTQRSLRQPGCFVLRRAQFHLAFYCPLMS